MRKLFSLFLALVATTTLWAHNFKVGGIYYNYLDGNNVEVSCRGNYYSDYDNEYAGAVIIPSTVTYNGTTYSVTSIGRGAFAYCSSLTSITIPNSVTSIGSEAFASCSSLTSIVIPNSVMSIENNAFYCCSSLSSVSIGNSVTSIGRYAFYGCSFTSITIPNSVTSIGRYAFATCTSLTSIVIPNSVTSIGDYAFVGTGIYKDESNWENNVLYIDNCLIDAKESISGTYTIKKNTRLIATSAFYNCSSLTSITIPNSVIYIGDYAFQGCSSLTSITIPNSVTSIGDEAFEYCSSLTSVTIGNSVTSIGSSAFRDCSSLTSVTIGNSVTSIGELAFYECSSIDTVVWNAKNCADFEWSSSPFRYSDDSITSFSFGDSVKHIPANLCSGMKNLTFLTIPESVTSIGGSAFYNCSSLTSVTINSDAIVNKTYSFSSNISDIFSSQVTEYIIGDDVKGIGDYAFYGCSYLTSVTIGNSVTSIGEYAFRDCSSLTSVTIPNSVTSIGDWAFYECSSLTSVTIGNSVTSIEDGAFYGCSLTSITIPNSVTSIGTSAFASSSSLTSITIGNSVTSIGDDAFWRCDSLASITCEATTPPTLGRSVFYGVSTSIPVYVPCGSENIYKAAYGWIEFTNIQEPQVEYAIQVSTSNSQMGTAIVNYNNCAGAQISATANFGYHFVQWSDGNTDNPRTLTLTQDTVLTAEFAQTYSGKCGDNLYWKYDDEARQLTISGFGEMYNYTTSTQPWVIFKRRFETLSLSDEITKIGEFAFDGCVRIREITLGSKMEELADYSFTNCSSLQDIYCYAQRPPYADNLCFVDYYYQITVHVPCDYLNAYQMDYIWQNFPKYECISSNHVETDDVVVTPGTNDVTITWPTEDGADTYTIVIKKDGEVVCSLTFNADGQLLNIAFAPGRDSNHPAQYAEAVANGKGFRFTVTGLEEGTHYTYNIDVKNTANQTINSHTGAFTTQSTTAVENTHSQSPMTNCQKIFRNGQLIILRDGVEYNAMGQEIQ